MPLWQGTGKVRGVQHLGAVPMSIAFVARRRKRNKNCQSTETLRLPSAQYSQTGVEINSELS